MNKKRKEIVESLSRLLDLNRLLEPLLTNEPIGTMLVVKFFYTAHAIEEYKKLPNEAKEKIDFKSFTLGYVIASWNKDFPDKPMLK